MNLFLQPFFDNIPKQFLPIDFPIFPTSKLYNLFLIVLFSHKSFYYHPFGEDNLLIFYFNHHPFGDCNMCNFGLTIILLVIAIVEVWSNRHPFDVSDLYSYDITIIILLMAIFANWWSYYHPFGDSKLCYWSYRYPFDVSDLCSYDLTIFLL